MAYIYIYIYAHTHTHTQNHRLLPTSSSYINNDVNNSVTV